MANKLIVTQYQLEIIRRNKPEYMTDEKFEKWIEDNVDLLKNLDEEPLPKGTIIEGVFVRDTA